MRIIIGGDLVPTSSNCDLFNNGNVSELLGRELEKLWYEADARVFNLETPLTDIKSPILKNGPCLSTPESTINGIKALCPSLITLANNHILDQGIDGLSTTTHLLNNYNIPYIGAGLNLNAARKPFIFSKSGKRIGFYACTEHEFSLASDDTPGANPFDPLESLDDIAALRSSCDYTIVLYHGGKEHYRYPSPYLQKVCRKIVDKGADLVVCQHSHCIGCHEEYNGSAIVYGQGNFIFNKYNNEYWRTGLLLKVNIQDRLTIDYIPFISSHNSIMLAENEIAQDILSSFEKRSIDILKEGFIMHQYKRYAESFYEYYVRYIAGFRGLLVQIDNRILKGLLSRHMYSKKQLLSIRNFIECETHRELFIQCLNNNIICEEKYE